MKWLLSVLIASGALTVLGLLRPWNDFQSEGFQEILRRTGITIAAIIWVLLPMVAGWIFLRENKHPITRSFLFLFIGGLLLVWGVGAIVTMADPAFDRNLGLLFWPVIEWVGLFIVFVVWAFENAGAQDKRAQQDVDPSA